MSNLSVQSWASASAILIGTTIVSKGLGLVREVLIAKYFGASGQVDAFMVAMSLPLLVGGGIGLALGTAFVPICQKILWKRDRQQQGELVGNVVILAAAYSFLFVLPLWVMPVPFIKLAAPSLPDTTMLLTAELTRWLCLYVWLMNLVYVLTAVYHALHHFRVPALCDLSFNVLTILILITFSMSWGIHALAFGSLLGSSLCVIALATLLVKGGPIAFRTDLRNEDTKKFLQLAIPVFAFELFSGMSVVIENHFASELGEGSVAAVTYAKQVSITLVTLLAASIARGAFPTLSTLYSEQRYGDVRVFLVRLNRQVIVVFTPLAFLFVIFCDEILEAVYVRGAFDATALETTSKAFLFYSIGVALAATEPILLRTSYALSDAMTPLGSTMAGIIIMIPLAYVLTPLLGIAGIALATNLALLLRVAIQAFVLQKKLGGNTIQELLVSLGMSHVCGLLAYFSIAAFQMNQSVHPVILAPAFIVLYFSLGWFLMREDLRPMGMQIKLVLSTVARARDG
jgi:putative peptidoglycan lipid II flippase